MKNFILVLSLFVSGHALSQNICERRQSEISKILYAKESRISFKNSGGLFNGGVCWWHARLQRSAIYLAHFEPGLPKPTTTQVREILLQLRQMNRIVLIPGFANFFDFTRAHQQATQKMLNGWQKYDGIFNYEWRRGISGRSSLPASELKLQMDSVFDYFKKSPLPIWIMAQMKGITSHSFLVVSMKEVEAGYELHVIDSNSPDKTRMISYRMGQTSLTLVGGKTPFIPYVGFQNDFRLIAKTLKENCHEVFQGKMNFDEIQDGVIEL